MSRQQLVLVGLDGVDGPMLRRWMSQGQLPVLESLRRDGSWSRIADQLRALRTDDGLPVVSGVYAAGDHETPPELLPDLVVEWHEVAGRSPLRLAGVPADAMPVGTQYTGQHTEEGFCLVRPGRAPLALPPVTTIFELRDAILQSMRSEPSVEMASR